MSILEDLNNPNLTQAEVYNAYIKVYKNHKGHVMYYFAKSDTMYLHQSCKEGFQVELTVHNRYGRTFLADVNVVIMSKNVQPRIKAVDKGVLPYVTCFA